MSRATRLAALVSELRAQRVAMAAVPLAAAALREAGFRVYDGWPGGAGLAVNKAPGLDAKLAALRSRGINPFVVVVRDLRAEGGDPAGEERKSPTGPATPHTTKRRAKR